MNPAETKKLLVIRHQMIGAGYHGALRALELGLEHHTGTRKDGVSAEFDHQVSIALYVQTLPSLIYREEVLASVFLHDIKEDYGIEDRVIVRLLEVVRPAAFVDRVVVAVNRMTKEIHGARKDPDSLFAEIADDAVASIAKGGDRIHNLKSMVGVFDRAKQEEYILEARLRFLPMLKRARKAHPEQTEAYENIKWMMTTQIDLIKAIHAAGGH